MIVETVLIQKNPHFTENKAHFKPVLNKQSSKVFRKTEFYFCTPVRKFKILSFDKIFNRIRNVLNFFVCYWPTVNASAIFQLQKNKEMRKTTGNFFKFKKHVLGFVLKLVLRG